MVARAPDLIDLVEAQFNRDLKHRSMETTTDLTLTGGVQTVALPSDFIEARSAVLQTTPLVVMTFVTPTTLDTNFGSGSSGIPSEFAIIGNNMKVGQIPDSGYAVELTYYQQIPALSDSNTTNWLLTAHPDIYLYGSLLQAAPYMSDDERIPVWGAFYDRAVAGIKKDDTRAAFSGGPLTSRVNVYTG